MVTLVRPEQREKHQPLNEVTEEGMVTLVRLEQPSKQQFPNEVTEEGMVTLVRLVQYLKQLYPIEVTEYPVPSLAVTLSGMTISPEYSVPLLDTTVAVLELESKEYRRPLMVS